MATPNRAALLVKTHKALKKHYTPSASVQRPLLEQALYAHCLENSAYEAADRAIASLHKNYFDLNEVRVTTVAELAEVMAGVHDPRTQAANLKRTLQGVFEATYSFDLEAHKKKSQAQATKDLSKLPGFTPFALAYITQHALGGHAIPIDKGAMDALLILGAVTPKEAEAGSVPGLERAIPKNKGIEFGSLLHQLGADLLAKPFSNEVRDIFLSIAPDAKERLPKRGVKKEDPPKAPSAALAPPAPPVEAKKPAAPAKGPIKKEGAPAAPAAAAGKGKPDRPKKPAGEEKPKIEAKKEEKGKKPSVPKAAPAKSDGVKAASKTLAKSKPR